MHSAAATADDRVRRAGLARTRARAAGVGHLAVASGEGDPDAVLTRQDLARERAHLGRVVVATDTALPERRGAREPAEVCTVASDFRGWLAHGVRASIPRARMNAKWNRAERHVPHAHRRVMGYSRDVAQRALSPGETFVSTSPARRVRRRHRHVTPARPWRAGVPPRPTRRQRVRARGHVRDALRLLRQADRGDRVALDVRAFCDDPANWCPRWCDGWREKGPGLGWYVGACEVCYGRWELRTKARVILAVGQNLRRCARLFLSFGRVDVPKAERPRCGARTRAGRPCRAPVVAVDVPGGPSGGDVRRRCRLHGGLSTGPTSAAGRMRALDALARGRATLAARRRESTPNAPAHRGDMGFTETGGVD